jgi:hypothetical protein
MLQNSRNGLQRFFREKSNQATIVDRCVLKHATEVAGEFITSRCAVSASRHLRANEFKFFVLL